MKTKMKMIIPLMLLPLASFAQEIAGHQVKEANGKFYAFPLVQEFRIWEADPRSSEICEIGRKNLNYTVSSYQTNNCTKNPSLSSCKSAMETVKLWVSSPMWGTRGTAFNVGLLPQAEEQSKQRIARELNIRSHEVKIISPTIQESSKWDIEVADRDNFFLKIIETFGLSMDYKVETIHQKITIDNRLFYCAVKDGAVRFLAHSTLSKVFSDAPSEEEVKSTYDLYQAVLQDWEKIEEKKWQNALHKMLHIGVILKSRLAESGRDPKKLEEYFDKFFATYVEDDTASVHVERFKTMEQFSKKAVPAREVKIKTNTEFKQVEL